MPVGTQGAVKALTHRDLEEIGAADHPRQHLSPVAAAGRRADRAARRAPPLHRLERPILTDSGGYQVFSLARPAQDRRERRRVPLASRRQRAPADAGARRRHPGAASGSDIAMVLDECPALSGDPRGRIAASLRADRRAGRRAAGRASTTCAGGPSTDVAVDQPRTGAVRHRPGRRVPGAARRERRARPWPSASRAMRSAG